MKTLYQAIDGTIHDDHAACQEYEASASCLLRVIQKAVAQQAPGDVLLHYNITPRNGGKTFTHENLANSLYVRRQPVKELP